MDFSEKLQVRAEAVDELYELVQRGRLEDLEDPSEEVTRLVNQANTATDLLLRRWGCEMQSVESVQDVRRAYHELETARPMKRRDRVPLGETNQTRRGR